MPSNAKHITGRHRTLATEDSDDENQSNATKLTVAKACELCPQEYRLIAKNSDYTSLDDMSSLSSLDYVDLTGNKIKSVEGLDSNFRLKTLILRGNELNTVEPILKLHNVRILNITDNHVNTTEWLPRASFSSELLVFVASGNKISQLEGISSLQKIETLIISNNEIEDISPISRLTSLKKFSASNNHIREIPSSFNKLVNLTEIRLAHNRISDIRTKVLESLPSLKILDIGHNRISVFQNLSNLPNSLTNINVRGNPGCEKIANITEFFTSSCPQLEVIDSKRITGGRRKIRVNRLRLAAGFELEPDRKFARPPPEHNIKQLQKEGTINASEAENLLKPTKSQQKQSTNEIVEKTKKRQREGKTNLENTKNDPKSSDEERETVVATDEFIRQAKLNTVQLEDSSELKVKELGKTTKQEKKKRKKMNNLAGDKKSLGQAVEEDFGQGQESQW